VRLLISQHFASPSQPSSSQPSRISASSSHGDWLGSLDTGAIKLRIVFKLADTSGNSPRLQSPTKARMDPATSATRDGSSLTLAFKNFGIDFTGKLSPIPPPSRAPSRRRRSSP